MIGCEQVPLWNLALGGALVVAAIAFLLYVLLLWDER